MKNRNRNLDWIIETGNFELEQENKKWNGFKKSEAIHGIYILRKIKNLTPEINQGPNLTNLS